MSKVKEDPYDRNIYKDDVGRKRGPVKGGGGMPKKLKAELERIAPTHQYVLAPESESDGEEMLEATYSSMEQPPLIKQLRGILSEYPDNGQIIKEMLQNAEDAEAHQVEIIYDERCINQVEDKKKTFRKFFKGPSLCVKNNSLFDERDWKGIKMIASSIKEDDKLKVGRFGLGFKSVFHMTDYPCIMSGDQILLVDPMRPSDQVNAEIKLKNLRKTRGMDMDAFFHAFRDTLNIDESIIEQGFYQGTVFWFPLREETSKISSTVYDREKVMDLFASFEHDSSEILLFLCHLESVSLNIRSPHGKLKSVASVEISGNKKEVQQRREDFIKLIKEVSKTNRGHEPVICTSEMTISTKNKNGTVDNTKWRIIHYLMGTNCSARLKQLINDPDLGFNPLVGVAMPATNTEHQQPFEGHVFCFMPLPREGSRLTGLPVHVNGFFSLSQNRHHLKWATDDQRVREIKDKDILWNQALIEECVPEAYKELFKILLKKANENRNDNQSVERIHEAVPDEKIVMDKWKRIPNQLTSYLNQLKILYSHCQKRYVLISEALFATDKSRTKDIIKVISQLDVNYVEASMDTITKLKFYNGNNVRDMTQVMLADLLRKNIRIFSKLSRSEKFSILSYLLPGNDYSRCLAGLPLLPVASGKWLTFGSGESVFICNSIEEMQLFEECQGRMIHQTSDLSEEIWSDLEKMALFNIAQIRKLDVTAFKELLNATLQRKVGPSHIISNQGQLEWYKSVWIYIENNFHANQFEDFPLMPELKEGTWKWCKKIQLHPLNGIFLNKNGMPDNISKCFNDLGAVVLNDFPTWFSEDFVSSYLCSYQIDDSTGICKLLGKLWAQPSKQRQTHINKFNSYTNSGLLDEFVAFMSNQVNLKGSSINLLRSLRMFKYGDFSANNTSYTSYNEQYVMNTGLPLRLPKAFIMGNEDSVQLLKRLGACEVTYEDQVLLILAEMRRGSKYSQQETKIFMNYFLEHIWMFLQSQTIMDLAYEIPFLKTEHGTLKAKDLFTPEDEVLKAMFCGETDKFPLDFSYLSSHYKNALAHLGLKEINKVSAQNVAEVTSLIHKWSSDPSKHSTCITKSNGVLALLNKNPSLLQHVYGRSTLHAHLLQQRFVACIHEKPSQFPTSLPHFNKRFCTPNEACERSYENECLVGGTMPLVDPKHGNLSSEFGWNSRPPCDKVIEQLLLLKQYFKVTEKSSTLPMIEQIYQYLSENNSGINFSKIKTEGLIWTGDSFEHPNNVIIRVGSQGLTSLRPYFFNIPIEFSSYEDLFETVGCEPEQTVSVLIEALSKIKEKHHNQQSYEVYERDFELVVKIIEKLAERRHEIQGYDVILPVQYDSSSQIRFHPASKSTVDKNAARFVHEEGDNTIIFVHQRISQDTAKALGAKPLNKQILLGTESMGIEGFGQTEKLTDRINKLISESYVDGLSVPKELIQNADDAGANVVKFLFDEREHEDARKLLLSQEMAGCQGPSLVVYNSATFSDADFENIKKLNGATKEMDKSKVGRFGLGFCAVYNLTDVPSFISRSTVVIFDPQKSYLQNALEDNSPGIKIDFKRIENRKLLRLHEDQFKPYKGLFGCDVDKLPENEYKGTIFRLPLRNSIQAGKSEISKLSYNRDEVCDLLTMLVKNVGNMLLFTQKVRRIELYHLPKMAKSFEDRALIFTASKKFENTIPKPVQDSSSTILQRVATALRMGKHFVETEQLKIEVCLSSDCSNLLRRTEDIKCSDETAWVIVWETGQKESLELSKKVREERAVPLSAVAVQCDPQYNFPIRELETNTSFYETGHLFCFLPLPIETSLPFHLNGSFHVTSDRRRLVTLTDDDKTSRKDRWNECLLSDASVSALFTLLEYFSGRNSGGSYTFHQQWPLRYEQVVNVLQESFFRRIIKEEKALFWGKGKWAKFSDIVFLNPAIRSNPDVGDIGFKMLYSIGKNKGKILVDIPGEFLKCFMKVLNIDGSVIQETEFLNEFLENVSSSYWDEHIENRNTILVYALTSDNTDIKTKIRNCNCIPVEPQGKLKRPCDVVHNNGNVSCLFVNEDEVFLHSSLQRPDVIHELLELGMINDILSDELLVDRFSSIEHLATRKCSSYALNRCKLLFQYLSDVKIEKDLEDKTELKRQIQNMHVVPVLTRPKGWTFSWKAEYEDGLIRVCDSLSDVHSKEKKEELLLGKASDLFMKKFYNCGGTVCCFVHEDLLKKDVNVTYRAFRILEIKEDIPADMIIKHICHISEGYKETEEEIKSLQNIFAKSFDCLQKMLKGKDKDIITETRFQLSKFSEREVVLVGNRLYHPYKVAFQLEHDCSPYLLKLPESYALSYKEIFEIIGVKQQFAANDVVAILQKMRSSWSKDNTSDIETMIKLLQNLDKCEDFNHEIAKNIVAPDIHGNLYPINELVITDDQFETDRAMHVIHQGIAPDLARKFGAKDKQRKCYEDITIGIPFGQKEKLVSRLKNLIDAYPCDSSIMKELLQNADDANASQIHFIKDYSRHSTDRIFGESCKGLQGPSLCVFNDSYFTDKDLQGIHDLGEGSKRDDPTKTGQYGVGFNSVYHLTDTPSFLTVGPDLPDEGLLVIFDPTRKHLPQVREDEPGVKCEVKHLRSNFPGVLEGFSIREKLFTKQEGTLFRLPLRTEDSKISKKVDQNEIDTILLDMSKDMFESLLFVKSVECIKFSNITSGELKEDYSVWTEISDEDKSKRTEFFDNIVQVSRDNKMDKKGLLAVEKKEVSYQIKLQDSQGRKKTYLIVQQFGFENPSEIPTSISQAFSDKILGCLPLGGVAFKMHDNITKNMNDSAFSVSQTIQNKEQQQQKLKEFNTRMFCFLPIPEESFVPVHVNAHFALDDARRGLIRDGYKREWNDCLLKHVVTQAYAKCIDHWRLYLVDNAAAFNSWGLANNFSDRYHKIFPLEMEEAKNSYSSFLIKCLYNIILSKSIPLFPVFRKTKEYNVEVSTKRDCCRQKINLKWVPLGLKGDVKKGCFNTMSSKFNYFKGIVDQRALEALLKEMGLDILQTKYSIKLILEKCDVGKPASTDPDDVIHFYASVFETQSLVGNLEETVIKTKRNLQLLLYFMTASAELFMEFIPQLPVLLKNDNNLKVFSKEDPVYNSPFCWMFPEHDDKFTDPTMDFFVQEKLLKEGYMKDFMEICFVELIPYKYKQLLCTGQPVVLWDRSRDIFPSQKWIAWFWKFIFTRSGGEGSDNDKFRDVAMKFSDWALIPAMVDNEIVLVKIDKAHLIVDMISFCDNEQLKNSIEKLSPFILDERTFEQGVFSLPQELEAKTVSTIRYRIHVQATSKHTPERLLELLYFKAMSQNFHGFWNKIDTESAFCILKYFNCHIDNDRFQKLESCRKKIKTLPLFETLLNQCVALDSGKEVVLVPSGMPFKGLDSFSTSMNLILLKTNSRLSDIFRFLKLESVTNCNFYAYYVLPNISKLPRQSWIDHITFIKDHVLTLSFGRDEDDKQKVIIHHLGSVPFIKTENGYKKCSEFYSTKNTIFKVMCYEDEFLPEKFRSIEWEKFLEALGLPVDINDDIMINFANRIAEGHPTNQSTREKAEILSKYFVSAIDYWQNSTLQQLSNICFIPPLKVNGIWSSVFPAKNDEVQLICTQNAVQVKHVELCWSTLHILPFNVITYQNKSKELCSYLGIHLEPPVLDVVRHCQNVSTELKHKLDNYQTIDIEKLMNMLYSFLKENMEPQIKDMLKDFPIIHLPAEKNMVKVHEIVLELSDNDVIKPYLFKAPSEYGPFWQLFKFLGTSSEVKCFHFLRILHEIAIKAGNNELIYKELRAVSKVISNLTRLIKDNSKREFGNKKFYLPNLKKNMCLSTNLVMVDNDLLFSRMKAIDSINYFIGSSDLGIHEFDVISFVDGIPKELRPKLLSSITREKFNTDSLKIVQNSIAAQRILLFIQSEEFVIGICRILRSCCETLGTDFNATDKFEDIKNRLSQINLIEVEEIQTYLLYENEIVEGSHMSQACFLDEECDDDKVNFYFRLLRESFTTSLFYLITLPNGLSEAIRKFTGISFDDVLVVASMMGLLDDPDEISKLLDKNSYPKLGVDINFRKRSAFPKPGTYVEEKFYPFLNQGLDCFDLSEYLDVAMELEDEELDADLDCVTESKPVFIYVHIIKELKTSQETPSLVTIHYIVDTGDEENVEVPGNSLYRFVRPENDTDSLAEYTGGSPHEFLPFDENCRRICQMLQTAWSLTDRERRRIIRRLILQWHPDRNRSSEEYATKIFQFIQHCILRLEQTGTLSDHDETDGRAPDFSNSSFCYMYNSVNRRAQAYARAYNDNLDEYNRCQRTGNYNHRNAANAEARDVSEARRWMRQAKRDFQAASGMHPQADDQKAFNWICYMCHQASEKALKAGCYSKNANAVSLQDHSLQSPARFLSLSLTRLAAQMENHLGQHTRMRYPNSVIRPQIPADIFNSDHAEKAIDIAREIIELADDLI